VPVDNLAMNHLLLLGTLQEIIPL